MSDRDDFLEIVDAVRSGLPASRWAAHALPERICLLTSELDRWPVSELGAIGLAEELRRAARIGAQAATSEQMPDLSDVLLIGGLPRTGTTFLHDLLADAVPNRRVIRGWEAFDPVRAGDPGAASRLIEDTDQRFRAARQVAPKLCEMHRLDARAIEECTPLLQSSLGCLQWPMMVPSSSYVEWLLSSRLDDTYRLWAAQLSMIDQTATAWLLKSPMHMVDYPSLFATAPRVRLVHIRRRADEIVQSFLNLCLEARRVFAESVRDVEAELGRFWLPVLARIIERAEQDLDDLRADVVVVEYEDLVANPLGVVRAIGDRVGVECAVVRESTICRPAVNRKQLPLEAFGLDSARVSATLGPYRGGRFLATG